MPCLRGLASVQKNKKEFLHLRLFVYISGKLCNTCHHPGLNCQTPAGFVLQGFFFYRPSMPQAAPKPCSQPGCGVLVRDGSSRCAKHPKVNSFADKKRGNRHERGYGTAWTKLREFVLNRDQGLCQPCEAAGRVTLAHEVDHKIPKAEGGTDAESNLQAICRTCHLEKTTAEAKRGVSRGWGASNL